MKKRIVSFVLCLYGFLGSSLSQEWTHHTVLDGDGRYHLYWHPPTIKDGNSEITFKVEVEAHGYVGFGLSPNGGMPGSDIVTGWIKDGKTYFQDRFATKYGLPGRDKKEDWTLMEASENDTHTILIFRRRLDTCDEEDMVIDDSTMRLIYAYSETDPDGEDPFYHYNKRGTKSVMLLQSQVQRSQHVDDPSILEWDVRSPDFHIPSKKTMYWCKIFKTPEIYQKHHIVYVKPLIQEGNEEFVHHMLLYECVGATSEEYDEHLDSEGHECHHPNMPEVMKKCEGVSIAWAVGGRDVVFPEHVGLPLEPIPGQYFMLEMHYDNPARRSSIVDRSGLRIYYTPNLRKYDAGCLMLGSTVTPRFFIPPGQKKYVVAGHSNPDCLDPDMPDSGIKALGTLLHAHLTGKRLITRHFRENKELVPLAVENNYDFNYQEYRYYNKEVEILPGDQLTVECTYDTSGRTEVTFGGQSTEEEMCLAFVLYYPRIDRYASVSVPTFHNIKDVLNIDMTITDSRWENLGQLYRALLSYDWNKVNGSAVGHYLRYHDHTTHCYLGNGVKDSVSSLSSYPKDVEPYIKESVCDVGNEVKGNTIPKRRRIKVQDPRISYVKHSSHYTMFAKRRWSNF